MGDNISSIDLFVFTVSIILLLSAVIFLIKSNRIKKDVKIVRKKHRIPDGNVVYTDLDVPAKPLFSKKYRIVGKPDYIIEKNHVFIPVEIKSGEYPEPQKHHVFQLAAYCQIVEESYRSFVPYGILVYNNMDYKIEFNPRLRFELEQVIKNMRSMLKNRDVEINHNEPWKCRLCSMRDYCRNRLI
ncbi:MAG: CRISPR-associated protein Cas4 [Thermoplasmata archaeon]|nr:MAG: CRISPR-associated protein Cas4 [Thermoplasmata archaeon]